VFLNYAKNYPTHLTPFFTLSLESQVMQISITIDNAYFTCLVGKSYHIRLCRHFTTDFAQLTLLVTSSLESANVYMTAHGHYLHTLDNSIYSTIGSYWTTRVIITVYDRNASRQHTSNLLRETWILKHYTYTLNTPCNLPTTITSVAILKSLLETKLESHNIPIHSLDIVLTH